MIVKRRTRLILGCLADVRTARARLAKCWRWVRRPGIAGSMWSRHLRQALLRLEASERLLAMAWECCVQRESVPVCDA